MEETLENLVNNAKVKKISKDTYEIDYGPFSVYINAAEYIANKDDITLLLLPYASDILIDVLSDLRDDGKLEYIINNLELDSLLPDVERVPDGSLGGGSDGYGRSWTVLGVFIPSQNKIKLVNSAGDSVLRHELGHWYAHIRGIPQPTREIAEYLAEKHQFDGKNLYDAIKSIAKTKYKKVAA